MPYDNSGFDAAPNASSFTVTAIISTHNRAHYLAEALDSLLGQERPPDELLVIDDASTDETAEVLATYQDRIRAVALSVNHGKAAALNMAIPMANGEYVWLFDDDDVALPDALTRHLEMLRGRDDIDFTYSSAYHTQDSENIGDRDSWHVNELPGIEPAGFLFETLRSMNTLMQGMLIPRAALLEIGLFDTDLQRCQDLDMLIRLGRRYRGARLDGPTFVYREHSGARGGGKYTHGVAQRFRVQDQYRKQVFRKVRDTLPLDDYLRHVDGTSLAPSAAARTPAARFQRGCILLRQGLVSDGLADLDTAFAHPAMPDVNSDWIAGNLTAALDAEPWMFDAPQAIARELAAILVRHDAIGHARHCARGLYWSLRRELSLGRTRQSVIAGALLAHFTLHYCGKRIKHTLALRA